MLIQKVVYVFAFTFFGESDYYWFLSVVLFIGSAVVFVSFASERPYYYSKTQKAINVLNGLFLWTNTILLLSCFIYTLDFTGNLPLLLLGLPFITLLILNMKDSRKSYLMLGLPKL